MLKFFLIFSLILKFSAMLYSQQSASNSADSSASLNSQSSILLTDNHKKTYPGKPLLMSLVLPGAGQFYNESSIWKVSGFLGVEIISILAWNHFSTSANEKRKTFQNFADENWSLEDWYHNWFTPTDYSPDPVNGVYWTQIKALESLMGTHDLTLILSGQLAETYGMTMVSSDSLESLGQFLNSGNIDIVRDRHFYENIGKYDQFLGGWSDARENWYTETKDVGDSIEIVIKTPMKQNFIDQRYATNQMLNAAKYSITVLMFNHVLSGVEAVWSSQKKSSRNKNSSAFSSKFHLVYNPENPWGIGGLSMSVLF